MDRPPHDDLERRLHRLFRDLPPHRAPDSLEDRVLAVLAAREARPWWRRSYAHWPVPARAAFLGGSAVAAALVIVASVAALRGVAPVAAVPVAEALDWWDRVQQAAAVLGGLVADRLPEVSNQWMQVTAAAVFAAYASLMGLGAVAYRLLRVRR
jgi:hypothetical protein